MVQFQKDAALGGIPFGVLEVVYPNKPLRRTEDFRILVEEHLRLLRAVRLLAGTEKAPCAGMRGEEVHTYPGDFCARDDEGIIFSMIAGADARTCVKPGSRHVFYPVFGVAGQPAGEIAAVLDRLEEYVRVLAPEADISRQLL